MKKLALILPFLSFFLCITPLLSQDFSIPDTTTKKKGIEKEKKSFPDWEKVYAGGDLGLQFGTVTVVHIAPDIGYKLTERYSLGVGLRYIHLADNRYRPAPKLDIYGASIFNRFIVTDFLFLHGEYEVLNGPWGRYSNERFNLNNVWVGGGLRQVAGNASLNIMALWNLNVEPYNPFPNPQIRMGIGIDL